MFFLIVDTLVIHSNTPSLPNPESPSPLQGAGPAPSILEPSAMPKGGQGSTGTQ